MTYKEVITNFADNTTFHGIPKLIKSRTKLSRFCWSVICFLAFGMFCLQMSFVLNKFFSYPKFFKVELVPEPVQFPHVTLCNMRTLDIQIIDKINTMFMENEFPSSHINKSDSEFINEYMKILSKFESLFMEYGETHVSVFQEVFSRSTFASNIRSDIISEASVDLKTFIVKCLYSGKYCNNDESFKKIWNQQFFNCFTYKPPFLSIYRNNLNGMENGLSVILFSGSGMIDRPTNSTDIYILPGLSEYRSAISGSEGVRVIVHPPGTKPFPSTEGFDVPPGFSVSLGVRPKRNIRLGLPYGNCSKYDKANGLNRLTACRKICLQSFIIDRCNCSDVTLPPPVVEVPSCKTIDHFPRKCHTEPAEECMNLLKDFVGRIDCIRKAKTAFIKNTDVLEKCQCFYPCDEITYDIAYSLTKWPSTGFEGDNAWHDIFVVNEYYHRFFDSDITKRDKYELFRNYFHETNKEAMNDFAKINVYMSESSVQKTQEFPDYTVNKLFSEIGGQVGLWVGLSCITLADILDLIASLLHFHGKNRNSKKKKRTQDNSEPAMDDSELMLSDLSNHYIVYKETSL